MPEQNMNRLTKLHDHRNVWVVLGGGEKGGGEGCLMVDRNDILSHDI